MSSNCICICAVFFNIINSYFCPTPLWWCSRLLEAFLSWPDSTITLLSTSPHCNDRLYWILFSGESQGCQAFWPRHSCVSVTEQERPFFWYITILWIMFVTVVGKMTPPPHFTLMCVHACVCFMAWGSENRASSIKIPSLLSQPCQFSLYPVSLWCYNVLWHIWY